MRTWTDQTIKAVTFCMAICITSIPTHAFTPPKPDPEYFTVNRDAVRQAARALGFMLSQTATLQGISKQHPDLETAAQQKRNAFDATFSFPEQRARWFLEDAIGKEQTDTFVAETFKQIEPTTNNISRQLAEQFLAEMDIRLTGDFDEPSLKSMLWLWKTPSPSTEMPDWQQQYSTAGHPKSAKLTINLRLPLSWKQEEGDRPHVVSKWTSQNGSGDIVVLLLVRELPGERITREDVIEVEETGDWEWMTPEGYSLLNGRAVTIDRQPGLETELVGQSDSLVGKVTQKLRTYTIFPDERMVQLSCSLGVSGDKLTDFQERRFLEVQELCQRVAFTVVFSDTYR